MNTKTLSTEQTDILKKYLDSTKEYVDYGFGFDSVCLDGWFDLEELLLKHEQIIIEKIENKFKDLLKNHCCNYHCECEKEHLYCDYELDHGIELESVIRMIKE
jgi:hypothetical protein